MPPNLAGSAPVGLLLLTSSRRPPAPKPRPIKAVRTELRTRLEEVAKFCTARKLFASRYDLDLVISLWPDDAKARKANGYTKAESGWSGQGRKRPRNLAAGGLPALRLLQDETAAWYRKAIETATRDFEPGERAARRARALGDAVQLAPDRAHHPAGRARRSAGQERQGQEGLDPAGDPQGPHPPGAPCHVGHKA